MPCNIDIIVPETGEQVAFIYSDAAVFLRELGYNQQVKRASHVEPTDSGQWTADMSPVGGPVLGPYPLRAQALAAEVAWLLTHMKGGAT
jgi:hypothetical protein